MPKLTLSYPPIGYNKAYVAWMPALVMTVSAVYELIEWAAALIMGQGADEFLGTQGDVWDTQSDMFLALIGACACLILLTKWHNRQLSSKVVYRP